MKNNNGLSGAQRHQLNMFLENNRESAASESDSAFAKKASEALGFVVTSGNVAGSRKAVGIAKKRASFSEAKIRKNAVNFVAVAVVNLYKELNIEIPDILVKIAKRERMEVEE